MSFLPTLRSILGEATIILASTSLLKNVHLSSGGGVVAGAWATTSIVLLGKIFKAWAFGRANNRAIRVAMNNMMRIIFVRGFIVLFSLHNFQETINQNYHYKWQFSIYSPVLITELNFLGTA